jgi:hypothetical protein
MRKLIAGINMTLDGYCDHTAIIPDEEMHQHYAELLSSAGAILYGRITYQLMEYWRDVLENPTGEKATDDFAVAMDKIPKIVFSHFFCFLLKSTDLIISLSYSFSLNLNCKVIAACDQVYSHFRMIHKVKIVAKSCWVKNNY